MKRIVLFTILMLGSHAFAGEYLVKYKNTKGLNLIESQGAKNSLGLKVMEYNTTASLVKVSIPANKQASILADLLSRDGIEYVVPNFKLKAFSAPVDPLSLRQQWAIAKVQAEKAWQRAGNRGSKNVVVAVIDTGADYKHESLAPNMIPGYNFKDMNNDPMDKTSYENPGHGTHCSGIVGATGLIDGGTIGMAPGISIMPLRFLDEKGSGDLNDGIKAIDYAIEKGVQVISASWGASVPKATAQPLLEAIKRADDKGIIFVAAAANDGKNNDNTEVYPANNGFPNSITVAASNSSDGKPSWSNYGTATVHLASPGDGIISTLPKNSYGELSGTSMATPLVSGLVAFLKSQDSSLTGAQIRAILQTTGVKVSIQTACNCRVDAFNAVDALLSKKMFVVPAAGVVAPQGHLNFSVLNGKSPLKFKSSNEAVATVTDDGILTGVAEGKTSVTVTDADGKTASTLDLVVGSASNQPPGGGDPGQQPPGDGSCPIGDPSLCQIICQIKPDLPFCKE